METTKRPKFNCSSCLILELIKIKNAFLILHTQVFSSYFVCAITLWFTLIRSYMLSFSSWKNLKVLSIICNSNFAQIPRYWTRTVKQFQEIKSKSEKFRMKTIFIARSNPQHHLKSSHQPTYKYMLTLFFRWSVTRDKVFKVQWP